MCWQWSRFSEDKLLLKILHIQFLVSYKISDYHWHQDVIHEDSFWLWWMNNLNVYWPGLQKAKWQRQDRFLQKTQWTENQIAVEKHSVFSLA